MQGYTDIHHLSALLIIFTLVMTFTGPSLLVSNVCVYVSFWCFRKLTCNPYSEVKSMIKEMCIGTSKDLWSTFFVTLCAVIGCVCVSWSAHVSVCHLAWTNQPGDTLLQPASNLLPWHSLSSTSPTSLASRSQVPWQQSQCDWPHSSPVPHLCVWWINIEMQIQSEL